MNDPAPGDTVSTKRAPRARRGRRVLRWLRRIALGLLVLLVVVLGAVVLVLYTATGSEFALQKGLDIYDGMIPGGATAASIKGSIAEGVELRDVRLEDRSGRPLVTAALVRLRVAPGGLPALEIETGTIRLDDVDVYLRDDAEGGFGDLGPDGPSEPKPPTPNYGPDLPVALSGKIAVTNATIHRGVAGLEPLPWIEVPELRVGVTAGGLEARVTLEGRAAMKEQDLLVHWLALQIAWSDPGATLESLLVQSNAGVVEARNVSIDLDAQSFALEVDAVADAQWLTTRSGIELPGDPRVELRGAGALDALSTDVLVLSPDGTSVALTVAGAWAPTPDLAVLLDAGVDELGAAAGVVLPALQISAEVDLAGDLDTGLDAQASVACGGCVDEVGPLRLNAKAFVGPELKWGSGDASVVAEGVLVALEGAMLPGGPVTATARVDIPQLADLAPLVRRFVPDLDLAGDLDVSAWCTAVPEPRHGVCQASVDLERGRPVRTLRLESGAWSPTPEEFVVELGEFMVEARDAKVELERSGARMRYSPERVELDDFVLGVSTSTGRGSVAVQGWLGLVEPRTMEAQVRIRDLALSAANAFVPALDAGGVLSAQLGAQGQLATPIFTATVNGRGLRGRGVQLGSVALEASYKNARATADVEVHGPDVGDVTARASIPVRVDLAAPEFALEGRRPASVHAELANVPLHCASIFVPSLSTLFGTLGATLDLSGSLNRPGVEATLELRDARFDGKPLPAIDARAEYDKEQIELHLSATHPTAFESLELDAAVPLDLNLARGQARWKSADPHVVDLRIDNAQIAEVTRWQPSVVAKGEVDLEFHARGAPDSPELDAVVHARGIFYDHKSIGETSFSAAYRDNMVRLELEASGPQVAGLGVVADVPVLLSLGTGEVKWLQEEDHRVRVSVNQLFIREAMRWLPPPENEPNNPISADGRLDALVSLDGTPAAPRLTLESTITDAVFDHQELGKIEVSAGYAKSRATTQVSWTKTAEHTARLVAEAPVAVNLATGTFEWNREGEHKLRLGVPRIDGELLRPFVDTGDLDATAALYLVVDGHPKKFEASASLTGALRNRGESHRLRARLELDQDAQSMEFDLGLGAGGKPLARIEAHAKAAVVAILDGADWKATEFGVTADIDGLDLRTVSAFTPVEVQDVRGTLTLRAQVDGTLGAPRLDGRVRLKGAAATIVPARQRLKNVELVAALSNEFVEISKLHIESGGGKVDGSGRVEIAKGAGVEGDVKLRVRKIPIRSPGLPTMAFTADIGTHLNVGFDEIGVGVKITKARVDVYNGKITAPKTIPTNDNVGFVDFDEPPPRDVTFIPVPDPPKKRASHFKVAITDPLQIIGPGVDMAWDGTIEANQDREGETAASGALTANAGGFDLLGNEFALERGSVTLTNDGSNVPFVDVVAITEVDGVEITATIRGALPKPELVLSSNPAMPESDIFTILVTGSADTQDADSEDVEAKAASVLAAMSNPALQRQLNDKLKVDKVGVGFGDSTDQPILTVGKHVTKKVYAETEYHHNAPKNQNRAELKVEYRFKPRWSLETFFGDAAAGGVDLFWGRAFDTRNNAKPKPKPKPEPEPKPAD